METSSSIQDPKISQATLLQYAIGIKPSQYFKVALPLFQPSDVENETKSDVWFSVLHNVGPTSVFDVETALKHRWYNFISTLFQRGLNISKIFIKTSLASGKYGFVNT